MGVGQIIHNMDLDHISGLHITVNSWMNGLKYFAISISPVKAHDGLETVVFVHLRSGLQLELKALKADFDSVQTATAGYRSTLGPARRDWHKEQS
ncbi:MAG: hypothetical protein WA125_15455 [Desulfosporosinus sp.]